MNNEIWENIEGFEGIYQVSSLGRVKNSSGRIMSVQIQNSGYALVHLYAHGRRRAITIHRLVAKAFIENPSNKSQVDHIDCVKTNNRVDNLRWATGNENMQYASASGRLDEAAKKAANRMKKVGADHGFNNSQNYLIKATPVILKIDGKTFSFRSKRQASAFMGIDHSTLTSRMKKGLYQ